MGNNKLLNVNIFVVGILRSVYTEPSLTADYIPVDIVIKAIIIATWFKAIEK